MGKEQILNTVRSINTEVEALYGVQRIGLFGSCVRERQRKKSDVDLLVSFSRDIDLFDF